MKNGFQQRLRESLSAKGITASELSRSSGVGKSDISNYLNGAYLAKQDKVYMLAKALNVDPGWLMTGVEPISKEDREADEFLRLINRLSPKNKRFVMRMIMDLLEGD